MERITDILWELFWLVAPAVVGYFIAVVRQMSALNFRKRVLRFNIKNPENSSLKFITANTAQEDNDELVTYGYVFEYRAAGELGATFLSIYGPKFKIKTTMSKSEYTYRSGELATNLVVIGGPFHNAVTREFFEKMGDSLPFRFDDDASLIYENPLNAGQVDKYTPKLIEERYYGEDYALIMNVRNPFNPEARVIFILGCRSVGCYGGAIFLSQQLKELKGKISSDEYAIVVSCSGDEEDLDAWPKLCKCYPLNIKYKKM